LIYLPAHEGLAGLAGALRVRTWRVLTLLHG
jgi:hypothetical protein